MYTYLDDLLYLICSIFNDYLEKLEEILQYLSLSELKVNTTKFIYSIDKIEYLGFCIAGDSIKSIDKKVYTILELDRVKNIRDIRYILSIIQYYRDL